MARMKKNSCDILQKLTAYFYLAFIVVAPLSAIGFWMIDKNFAHLPKLIYYPVLFFMLSTLIKHRFILKDWFVIYLCFYSIIVIALGLLWNPISKPTFAHLQPLYLPIIAISFGYFISKHNSCFFKIFEKNIMLSGILLLLLVALYFFLNITGAIPYFGASTLISIPFIYALSQKRYDWAILFFVVALFTGKRTVILGMLIVLIIMLLVIMPKRPIISFIGFAILASTGVFIYFNIEQIELLRRFTLIFSGDVDLNTATSGRLVDVLGAINSINENWYYWIVGKGVGATFLAGYSSGLPWVTHYTHFTPVSYIFLGGILLMVPFYIKLTSILVYSFKSIPNFYSMLYIYYFTVAISGATLFTDPFVWIVAGIVLHQQRLNKLSKKLSNLNVSTINKNFNKNFTR